MVERAGTGADMTADEMVADAKTRVPVVTREQLEAELEAGETLLVDIRDIRERWRSGAIPGARHVPRGMLEFWADPTNRYHKPFMDPARRTVLHCAGGARSALAAEALMKLGYRDVAHLEIGFDGWRAAGGAVRPVPVPDEFRGGLAE
ncbi:MAG: rhodanese-like domain-containing protein [Candidatus Dormibacteraceae bacterium]